MKLGKLISKLIPYVFSASIVAGSLLSSPVQAENSPKAAVLPIIGINTDVQGDPWKKSVIYLQYVDAIRKAGGVPILLPPMNAEQLRAALSRVDGVLMIGGDDYPPSLFNQKQHEKVSLMATERSDFDMLLAHTLLDDPSIPVLGICAGCQALNIASGGDLVQDIPSAHPESKIQHSSPDPRKNGFNKHDVALTADSKIAAALKKEKVTVVTSHHQCVGKPGNNMKVVAKSDDGIVEAIEAAVPRFVVGVQWHPERDFETCKPLFEEFVKQCAERREKQTASAKDPALSSAK